jgi:uncharacterized protein (TIGR01777 family)
MKKILITGGTGFIGRVLLCELLKMGYQLYVLTRNKAKSTSDFSNNNVILISNLKEIEALCEIDAIINLAGEPIANKRWTVKQKNILLQSRLKITNELVELCQRLAVKPKVLISASAVGFYGNCGNSIIDESCELIDENCTSFARKLCIAWESEALKCNTRTCIARFGVVLDKNQGAFKKMSYPFSLGIGGKIGNGKQYFSWIHIQDAVNALIFLIQNDSLSGVFNVTSPSPATNEEFTKCLATVFHKPAFCHIHSGIIKLIFGQMGEEILLYSQRVLPRNLLNNGFKFKYETIEECVKAL